MIGCIAIGTRTTSSWLAPIAPAACFLVMFQSPVISFEVVSISAVPSFVKQRWICKSIEPVRTPLHQRSQLLTTFEDAKARCPQRPYTWVKVCQGWSRGEDARELTVIEPGSNQQKLLME